MAIRYGMGLRVGCHVPSDGRRHISRRPQLLASRPASVFRTNAVWFPGLCGRMGKVLTPMGTRSRTRIHISPPRGLALPSLRELRDYRELLLVLATRDIRVQYRQTILGAGWAVLRPVLTTVVFTIFFGGLLNVPSDGGSYPLFALAALVPWTFFSAAATRVSESLVSNAQLVTKIYFPRIAIPTSAMGAPLVDLFVGGIVLLVATPLLGGHLGTRLLAVPLIVGFLVGAVLGPGLWLAALNVLFRDVRYAVPFLVQTLLFVSPVAYGVSAVPVRWHAVYGLNPMSGVIHTFRWVFADIEVLSWSVVYASVLMTIALLASGALFFARTEQTFADVV